MCETQATRVLHERQECDTSENFNFDNDTSENVFSHPYIRYIANQRLLGEEEFHSKELPFGNASIPIQNAFKKCTTKTEFRNGKSYFKKLYTRL